MGPARAKSWFDGNPLYHCNFAMAALATRSRLHRPAR
jgi:hypothetical protein